MGKLLELYQMSPECKGHPLHLCDCKGKFIVLNISMFVYDFKEYIWNMLRTFFIFLPFFRPTYLPSIHWSTHSYAQPWRPQHIFSLPHPFLSLSFTFLSYSLYCLHLQMISNKVKEIYQLWNWWSSRTFMSPPTTVGRKVPERCGKKTKRKVDDFYPSGPVCYSTVSHDQE